MRNCSLSVSWWSCPSQDEEYIQGFATREELAGVGEGRIWAFRLDFPGVKSVVVRGASDAAVNQTATIVARRLNRWIRMTAGKGCLQGQGRCERAVSRSLPPSFLADAFLWTAEQSPGGDGDIWDDWESKSYMTAQALRMASIFLSYLIPV